MFPCMTASPSSSALPRVCAGECLDLLTEGIKDSAWIPEWGKNLLKVSKGALPPPAPPPPAALRCETHARADAVWAAAEMHGSSSATPPPPPPPPPRMIRGVLPFICGLRRPRP